MAGVVLNAFAMPDFAEHFQIEPGALLQTLGFDQFAHAHQFFEPVRQLHFDGFHRRQHLVAWRHIVARWVDREARNLLLDAAGERIKQLQAFDLVVKEFDANGQFRMLGRKNVDRVPAHPKFAATEIHVVALVLHANQLRNHVALAQLVAGAQRHDHAVVALGLANAVNRRHRGDDHHIAPLHDAFGAGQAHLLNVLVDRTVFFNEQIALRHIGLGLVVVVVADEILHRVFREKLAKFAVQLGGQRLVGRKHDGRAPQAGDHIGHGEGLARAGHAQQGLKHLAVVHAFHQFFNRRGLVSGWRIGLKQLKRRAGITHKMTRRPLVIDLRKFRHIGNCGAAHQVVSKGPYVPLK